MTCLYGAAAFALAVLIFILALIRETLRGRVYGGSPK